MTPRLGKALFAATAVLAGSIALGATPSCSDELAAQPCDTIPAGGCPLSRGVACEDPACEAVYACRPGKVWELERACPPRDAGAVVEGSTDAEAEAAPSLDASIDAPAGANGGPGCAPLQPPDCALGLALACSSGCCGCEDLFVCQNGGWTFWSTCPP